MVKPFNPQEWTSEMKEAFHCFTSHDYEYFDSDGENNELTGEKNTDNNGKQDISLMSRGNKKGDINKQDQIWIGDTGTSCHRTNYTIGLINLKAIESNIVSVNGEQLKATHIGDKKGYVRQNYGTERPIVLKKVKFVPNLACNLLSISTALQNRCTMEGLSKMIKLKKGKSKNKFDQKLKKGKGNMYGIRIIDKIKDKSLLSMNKIHDMLGHTSKHIIKAIVEKLNMKLTGK